MLGWKTANMKMTGQPAEQHRPVAGRGKRFWLAIEAGVVAVAPGGAAWGSMSGAGHAASPSDQAALAGMAGVFDGQLAGFKVSYTPFFADGLAAIRSGALRSAEWPDADYALLHGDRGYESNPQAVGLLVWVRAPGTESGWTTLCAEAQVDRARARVRLRAESCLGEVPSVPVHSGGSAKAALPSPPSVQVIRNRLQVPALRRSCWQRLIPARLRATRMTMFSACTTRRRNPVCCPRRPASTSNWRRTPAIRHGPNPRGHSRCNRGSPPPCKFPTVPSKARKRLG